VVWDYLRLELDTKAKVANPTPPKAGQ